MKNEYKLPGEAKQLETRHLGPIYVIKFTKSGEYCMTGSEDRSVNLYNPSKNFMIKTYKHLHNYDVYGLDIANDNSKFITGGGDKNIVLTDVIEAKPIRKYTGHHSRVNSVAFNSQNNVIVSASYDTTVKCWDNRSNANLPIQTIKGFKDSVSQVQIINNEIICGCIDGSVRFYDIRKGELIHDTIDEGVQRFSIAKSGRAYVVSATNSKIYLIERQSGKKIQEYHGHNLNNFTIDCTFNFKDTHVISGSVDGKLYIYDILRQDPIKILDGHNAVLSAIDFHQTVGMVSAAHDGTVCFWKI